MHNQIWAKTQSFFTRPKNIISNYQRGNLRPDITAGLTVAIVLLPQAIAYAMIAELPPQVGLYSAIVAAIIGALWGSSNHLHTGPTNAASLLVLTILLPIAEPGSPEYLAAAGLMAVMVGIFRLVLGLARLGMLVNFVSDSVIIGFTAGAGVLISANQLRHFLRLEIPSHPSLIITLQEISLHIQETHLISLGLGLLVILAILLLRYFIPKAPAPLIGMILGGALVAGFGLQNQGVSVIGELPQSLPPLSKLPGNIHLISNLSTGALAVGAIGLVEAMAIARSIASQSGQRLDSNQEFVGQGLANIACGLFTGYTTSGSFTRSAVNYDAQGRTPLASVFSGIFVLIFMLVLGPLGTYVPRTALAGVLLLTAYKMVDQKEIRRIWQGSREDAFIMVATFLSTLLLQLQFAVLIGILTSLAIYILRTSVPNVIPVLPAKNFRHFTNQPESHQCPQIAIFDILGDLYFGAANHVEEILRQHLEKNPSQRFLLLRMISVHQCDISGIHILESIVDFMRERGGDVYFMRVQPPVLDLMKTTGFYDYLGPENCLSYDQAISFIYHHVLDPAICIYECEQRVFLECQNLPKRIDHPLETHIQTEIPLGNVPSVSPLDLWQELCRESSSLVIDVREPREFNRMRILQAQSIPLFMLLSDFSQVPQNQPTVFVCHGGRRSSRAAYLYTKQGYENIRYLEGGMLAWEAACLLEAIEETDVQNE
jgi:sulfate permease, SulP family